MRMLHWTLTLLLAIACQAVSQEPPSSVSLVKGKRLYKQNCAACHGIDGQGHTPMGKTIPNIPDLTNSSTKEQSDQELFDQITNGKPPMPSFRQLSEKERWDLVKYVRTLEK